MASDLPDYAREEKGGAPSDLPAYAREEKPAPAAPEQSALETFINRLGRALPGRGNPRDGAAAETEAMRAAGVPANLAVPGVTRLPPEKQTAVDLLKPMFAATQAARQAQAGADHPFAAGLGNNVAPVLGLAAMPGVGKALGTIGPAAEALSKAGVPLAGLLTKALAGGALSVPMSLYKGEAPTPQSVGHGAAMVAAPFLTGAATSASALAPNLTPEERATRGIGGATLMVPGALQGAAESVPGLRTAAENNTIRAQGAKLGDIRKAGGVEGARGVARTLLDEGLVPLLPSLEGSASRISQAAQQRLGEIGSKIGGYLDEMSPNSGVNPVRMTPAAISLKAANDVLPQLKGTWATANQAPAAEALLDTISQNNGSNAPVTFQQLNAQKTALGNQAYKAANPLNPSPNAEMLQAFYRSLNNHMENVGGDVAASAGPEAFEQWLKDKATYGNLSKASGVGATAEARHLANRSVSPSDYIAGAAEGAHSGLGPKAAAAALANKLIRENGSAILARGFNGLAKIGAKVPNVFGDPNAAPVSTPPSEPPLPGINGQRAAEMTPANGPAGDPESLLNKATALQYNNLYDMLYKGKPFGTEDLVHPKTGETLIPATGEIVSKGPHEFEQKLAATPPDQRETVASDWRDRAPIFDKNTDATRRPVTPTSETESILDALLGTTGKRR